MIDFWCTVPHYAEHLRPFYDALPSSHRGQWLDANDDPPGGAVLVAGAYRDLAWMRQRYPRVALVEHGIGQTYSDNADHPGYPGGLRDPYDLLLAPGPHVDDPAARAVAYVGCTALPSPLPPRPEPARMAVSFHWDCPVSPEAGTLFWEFLPQLQTVAQEVGGLLVHAHPRIQFDVFEQLEQLWGCTPCPSFADVIAQADVYAVDNSSTLFEFAALDRPVVVLNGSRYRASARHGKRFWEWADIGENIWGPADLTKALLRARSDDPQQARRRELVGLIYQGNTQAGVEALLRLCA